MKKCINCGAELQNHAQFCSECGTKQVAKKQFCSECGAEIPAGSKFCMECGTPVVNAPSANVKADTPLATPSEAQPKGVPAPTIEQPDENTLAINYKGVPFELKLVLGQNYGTNEEIPDFYIAKTPVTQILWYAVMNNNPSTDGGNPYFPVTNVTPSMATSFLVKLQKELGVKFELPTKAQWDYAYAGGHKTKHFKFSGSNDLNEVGWTDRELHPVGELFENELGLVDMEGLVEEYQKGGSTSMYKSDNNQYLNDDNLTGIRFVVDIPKEGFADSSPIAEMVNRLKSAIDKHHSDDAKNVKKKAIEKATREKAEAEEAKQKAEEKELKNSDPKTWKVEEDEDGEYVGLVDQEGNWRIKPIFEEIGSFHDGMAKVLFKDKYGFIDEKGNFVIEPKFDDMVGGARTFENGLVAVKSGSKWGYINKKGEWVARPRFDDVGDWRDWANIGAAKIGDKWGPVDINGNWEPAENQTKFILDAI